MIKLTGTIVFEQPKTEYDNLACDDVTENDDDVSHYDDEEENEEEEKDEHDDDDDDDDETSNNNSKLDGKTFIFLSFVENSFLSSRLLIIAKNLASFATLSSFVLTVALELMTRREIVAQSSQAEINYATIFTCLLIIVALLTGLLVVKVFSTVDTKKMNSRKTNIKLISLSYPKEFKRLNNNSSHKQKPQKHRQHRQQEHHPQANNIKLMSLITTVVFSNVQLTTQQTENIARTILKDELDVVLSLKVPSICSLQCLLLLFIMWLPAVAIVKWACGDRVRKHGGDCLLAQFKSCLWRLKKPDNRTNACES
ncbi:hypothetical protein HELRODRAFT_173409 [Helobdella robusta]|uniref:Uncharacterized protein n=1 Tax=Helobdella robusta TaxID=6412 RepID=T1F6S5_HELRO|nr:hypothetical protein HELRODRAFT_173409 [Helobdella robusta]ESO03708.1 hypothetical protein HELRODRAFT_173409 [Helobdella robusta]